MATMNIACTQAAYYSYSSSGWSGIPLSNSSFLGYIPQNGSYPIGISQFSFGNLPSNIIISSAIATFQIANTTNGGTQSLKSRVSNANHAYTTSAPDDTISTSVALSTTVQSISIDITSQLSSYVSAGEVIYLYAYQPDTTSNLYYLLTSGNAPVVTITYEYTYTNCGAPTLSVDNASPSPSETVTISGSGATAGTDNPITGYRLYRSTNGGVSYAYLQTIATTETSFSQGGIAVPSVAGESYLFKAVTVGTASGYDSDYSSSITVTTLSDYCTAPTSLSLSSSIASRKPTLSWLGAAPGAYNAITAYEIQYSESTDNATWGAWTALKTLPSDARSGSTLVDIAAALGSYRKYRIRTQGELGATYYSDWSAASSSVRTASSTLAESQTPRLIAYEYPHVVSGVEKGPYPLGMVNVYSTLIVRRAYRGVSIMSLSLPFTESANELLECANLIGIAGKDELFRIVNKTIRTDDTGVEVIELTAQSLVSLLGLRVVKSSTVTTGRPVAQIKAVLRGQSVFLEHYSGGVWVQDINGDLLSDNYGDQRFPDFHWKEPTFDAETTASLSFQPEKLTSLLDTVVSLCALEGCGLRVTGAYYTDVSDTFSLWFELYKGIDRSTSQDVNPHVVFSEHIGNVISQTYTRSIAGTKTAGYATCKAIDTLLAGDLLMVDAMSGNDYYVNNANDVNGGSGMNRSEIGMTVSEVTTPTTGTTQEKAQSMYASCKQIVKNEIAKAPEEVSFAVVINTSVGPQYGIDYDLGDIVTAMNARYGVSMNARIAEAIETYEPGKKPQISLTLGETSVSLLGKVKQITRRRG